jgi:glyoxylase-like metal-dependent hydrolase (beta-lactamase superfamily II)
VHARSGRAPALLAAAAAAGCSAPFVRANRQALTVPQRSAVATTNGRTASQIFAARTAAGVVVVDLGWGGAAGAYDRALTGVGARRGDVVAVLLTHSHRDHVGAWRAARGAPFYVGAAEVPLLFGERAHGGWAARAADWLVAPRLPRRGEVRVVPVGGDTVLTFGADTVRGYALPGHTAGSMAWLVHGVLFVGDGASAVAGTGRLRPARSGYAEDVGQARRSLTRVRRAVAAAPPRLVCTAHARCAEATPATWAAVTGERASPSPGPHSPAREGRAPGQQL